MIDAAFTWILTRLDYFNWRYRRDGSIVCITRHCWRMIAEPAVLHCRKHAHYE